MSGREWKPGEVWLVEAGCWANPKVALRLAEGWSHTNGVNVDGDGIITPARRLVVIDPADRKQVERLRNLYDVNCQAYGDCRPTSDLDPLFDALVEFADPKPPKPEEPTGLGAVVEDDSQVEFIHLGSGLWAYGTTDGPSKGFTYNDIAAVRVLSDGVQAGDSA